MIIANPLVLLIPSTTTPGLLADTPEDMDIMLEQLSAMCVASADGAPDAQRIVRAASAPAQEHLAAKGEGQACN